MKEHFGAKMQTVLLSNKSW